MIDQEQIQAEASKHYLVGSASYYAFIIGAEWVLKEGGVNEKN